MEIGLRSGVRVTSRLKTLYSFIYEMAESFGADETDLAVIEKGVLKQQILKEIQINYVNADDVVAGRVILSVDWEEHRLRASTNYGASFELNPEKSVHAQLTELSDIIIDHVNKMRDYIDVRRIDTHFTYIDEIYQDKKRLTDARSYLGLKKADNMNTAIDPMFMETFRHTFDQLSEVTVSVSQRK